MPKRRTNRRSTRSDNRFATRTGPRAFPQDVPVARVTSPGQLAAAVPHMMGFVPSESLVVLCGHEPRGRLGLTMRFDLPDDDGPYDTAYVVDEVADRVRAEGATRYSLLVYTDQPGALPYQDLVEDICDELAELRENEVLLVWADRWRSYHCAGPCCPPEGTPLEQDAGSAPILLVQTEAALTGRSLAGSREELAAQTAGPTFLAAELAAQRCDTALRQYADAIGELGVTNARLREAALWERVLDRWACPPATLSDAEAAALAVSLHDVLVRDDVVSRHADPDDPMVALLEELLRRTPDPYDAPVAGLLAWLTYAHGGGARTSIALERALRSDPELSIAQLVASCLHAQIEPEVLRNAMTGTRRLLEEERRRSA